MLCGKTIYNLCYEVYTMNEFQDTEFWDSAWDKYFEHYQQDPRHAYYINAFLNDDEEKILEIAAGSFRDFNILNSVGKDCFAFDNCENAVNKAKKLFSQYTDKISMQNAFATTYQDKEFDFSYHNGFWGCFNDKQILQLAKEQIRITKKRFAFTVHNGYNQEFIQYFVKLKQHDKLYDIRFFTLIDIYHLMTALEMEMEKVKIYPVGKYKKYLEDELILSGKTNAKTIKNCIEEQKLNNLFTSEKLLCIVRI